MTGQRSRRRSPTLVSEGYPLRADFDGGARLHVDRLQPFLILHRSAPDEDALVAQRIAVASGTYCLRPGGRDEAADEALREVYDAIADRFGTFLLIEIAESEPDDAAASDAPELPTLAVTVSHSAEASTTAAVGAFVKCLEGTDLKYSQTSVGTEAIARGAWNDHGLPAPASAGVVRIGIPSVYREAGTGTLYPELLERISAVVYDSLLRAVFAFAEHSEIQTPPHYRGFGRTVLEKAVKHIDRAIDSICNSFDFLLCVTPINAEECWHEFSACGFESAPRFRYRPLPISTDAVKRQLHAIDVDVIEDPVLIDLFREKQRELDHQLTMLQLRGTGPFKQASILVYGDVPSAENADAEQLLEMLPAGTTDAADGELRHDCHAVKAAAIAMAKRYRARFPAFLPRIVIRDDLPAGLLVTGDALLISRYTSIPDCRLHALLSHEIGVHLVTHFTGATQPLRIFRSGLAGYEGVQEGLGVFAEFATDGLTMARLRLLAARVIACRAMLEGASFVETFRMLEDTWGFSARAAFNITVRTHRGGGLAKDAIYLRGLIDVFEILRGGGELDAFWIGKIAPHHVGAIQELLHRDLLQPAALRPEFLDDSGARQRIERARESDDLWELLRA